MSTKEGGPSEPPIVPPPVPAHVPDCDMDTIVDENESKEYRTGGISGGYEEDADDKAPELPKEAPELSKGGA